MKMILSPRISDLDQCPYLKEEMEQHEFFFSSELNDTELDFLLERGWRKFGQFIFRPLCPNCQKCIPIRVDLKKFKLTKNQSKFLKRNHNKGLQVKFSPLLYRQKHFEIYRLHGQNRFVDSIDATIIDNELLFKETFYRFTGTQLLSEVFFDNKLIAFGILEQSQNALSSVYFCYDPQFEKMSLGHLGALAEIMHAKNMGLDYYYLGYWIEENEFMKYKSRYTPYQLYDWGSKSWES